MATRQSLHISERRQTHLGLATVEITQGTEAARSAALKLDPIRSLILGGRGLHGPGFRAGKLNGFHTGWRVDIPFRRMRIYQYFAGGKITCNLPSAPGSFHGPLFLSVACTRT